MRLGVEGAAGVRLLEAVLQVSPLLQALVLLLDVAQDLFWKTEVKQTFNSDWDILKRFIPICPKVNRLIRLTLIRTAIAISTIRIVFLLFE